MGEMVPVLREPLTDGETQPLPTEIVAVSELSTVVAGIRTPCPVLSSSVSLPGHPEQILKRIPCPDTGRNRQVPRL